MTSDLQLHDFDPDSARIPMADDLLFTRYPRRPDVSHRALERFGDDRWPLNHIDHSSSEDSIVVDFATLPEWSQKIFKIYLWNVMNTAPVLAEKSRRAWLAPVSISHCFVLGCRAFARWLDRAGLHSSSDFTINNLERYARHVDGLPVAWHTKALRLMYLSRLHMHNRDLPEGLAFPRPPWFGRDLKPWLGPAPVAPENRIEPIPPEVMGPLLEAALWVIDSRLDGSLAIRKQGVRTGFDRRALRGACLLVVAYLTGMRPKELLHLKQDCLAVDEISVRGQPGVRQHTIRGTVFKNVTDAQGRAATQGATRQQPWVTIEPAARAVEVARTLTGVGSSDLLFPLLREVGGANRARVGDAPSTSDANKCLRLFVEAWNNHALLTGKKVIPVTEQVSDEVLASGVVVRNELTRNPVTLARFRRTLAWHIVNQPGGEVALGVQYGHVRRVTALGYSGRIESGFPDELELEELLSAWADLDLLSDEIVAGSSVSGPAAGRLTDHAEQFVGTFRGQVQTEAQLRRLRDSGLAAVHDNPDAGNVCVFRPSTAACLNDDPRRDQRATPDLQDCRTNCGNIAMLDRHRDGKQAERDALVSEAALLPKPLADRNLRRAEQLDHEIARHGPRQI